MVKSGENHEILMYTSQKVVKSGQSMQNDGRYKHSMQLEEKLEEKAFSESLMFIRDTTQL